MFRLGCELSLAQKKRVWSRVAPHTHGLIRAPMRRANAEARALLDQTATGCSMMPVGTSANITDDR